MKVIPVFLVLLLVAVPASAQSIISFELDSEKLIPGEIVELNGQVEEGLEGQPVAVEIKDSEGNVILIRTVTPDSDGKFVLKFKVPSAAKSGEFDIVANVEVDGQPITESQTVQSIKAEPELIPEPEPKPEPTVECGEGTVMKDGQCVPEKTQTSSEEGGGCLIATAAYGSELAPQVQFLREIRDNTLLQTQSGFAFMSGFNQFYYSFSPQIADWERQSPVFKEFVKVTITPMLSTLSIMQFADPESEISVTGYGLSIITLNLGLYFGIPIGTLLVIKKRKLP